MWCFKFIFLCFIYNVIAKDCNIVSKKDWGGLGPVKVLYLARPVDLVIIAHTATPTCNTDNECKSRVQNIQTYHMDQLQYPDIGPSFIVGGNGKVYEGSGWLHVGSHTYGYNKRSIAIMFVGNFNNDHPTSEALQAAQDLIRCGVENGHLVENYKLVGHRQIMAIESPGRNLYDKIRRWSHWTDNVSNL